MCGICGVARCGGTPVEQAMLDRMTDSMRHRGPDSRGTYVAPGVGLGVRRLSIIDVEGGDQPISSEDGSITLVCNGEIYNYIELRMGLEAAGHRFRTRTDIETILHLYEDHGVNCVKRLRGMFAFALWDSRNRSLMLARDRLGIKPLFYHLGRMGISFGSEIKAILFSDSVERSINPLALDDLMAFGFVRTPRTFVEGVAALPPGRILHGLRRPRIDMPLPASKFPGEGRVSRVAGGRLGSVGSRQAGGMRKDASSQRCDRGRLVKRRHRFERDRGPRHPAP